MNKSILKWSPVVPMRKPDNLISSHAKQAFKPSYENDPTENMNFLMSNEYMRIWFKEKGAYEKDTYTREQIIKDESKIKRRIIQRMMTYRKPSKNQFIEDYVQRKTQREKSKESKDQGKRHEKMKYKPACPSKAVNAEEVKTKSKRPGIEASKTAKDNEESDECENECEIVIRPAKCNQKEK